METYWNKIIIIVLVVVILLQWMTINNLKSDCSNGIQYDTKYRAPVASVSSSQSVVPVAHTISASPLRGSGGVAVTTFLGSPKWYQNRYSMMVNQMLAVLPEDWAVQIFYQPANKMALEGVNYPGLRIQYAVFVI